MNENNEQQENQAPVIGTEDNQEELLKQEQKDALAAATQEIERLRETVTAAENENARLNDDLMLRCERYDQLTAKMEKTRKDAEIIAAAQRDQAYVVEVLEDLNASLKKALEASQGKCRAMVKRMRKAEKEADQMNDQNQELRREIEAVRGDLDFMKEQARNEVEKGMAASAAACGAVPVPATPEQEAVLDGGLDAGQDAGDPQ